MKFNYGRRKIEFIREWKRLEKEYKEAGMSDDAIKEMKAFDWEMFKKERIFCMHNQLMTVNYYPDGNRSDLSRPSLMDKFYEEFSYEDKHFINNRYGWIECLDDETLTRRIKELDNLTLECITMFVFEGMTLEEIAAKVGLNVSSISRRIKKIKKF